MLRNPILLATAFTTWVATSFAAPALAQRTSPHTVEFSARIVDVTGKPIVGAGVCRFATNATPPSVPGHASILDTYRCKVKPDFKSDASGWIRFSYQESYENRAIWLLGAAKRSSLRLTVWVRRSVVDGKMVFRAALGEVVLPRGADKLGMIKDKDGNPVAGARVSAIDVVPSLLHRGRRAQASHHCYGISDERGVVRMFGMPTRGTRIEVRARGHYVWSRAYMSHHAPLVVGLEKGGLIRGVILDTTDKPYANVSVQLRSESHASVLTTTTKVDGSFERTLPGKGRYRVDGHVTIGLRNSWCSSGVLDDPKTDLVLHLKRTPSKPKSIAATSDRDEDKDDDNPAVLILKLVDAATGNPLRLGRGATMWTNRYRLNAYKYGLDERLQAIKSSRLDERGTLRLAGPRRSEARTGILRVVAEGYVPQTIAPFVWIEDGGESPPIKMTREAVLAGVVVDAATQKPIPGVKIVAVKNLSDLPYVTKFRRNSQNGIARSTTEDSGEFRLAGLDAGVKYLIVTCPDRAILDPIEVRVNAAESVTDMRIEFPAGGSLRGKIVGVEIQPGWRVRIRRVADLAEPRKAEHYESASVDADGSFVIPGLNSTSYDLRLAFPPLRDPLEVQLGEVRMSDSDKDVEFDMRKRMPGRIAGRIKLDGAWLPPGRLLLVAQPAAKLARLPVEACGARVTGTVIEVDAQGGFDAALADGLYLLHVIDVKTRLRLNPPTDPITVETMATTRANLTVRIAKVHVRLVPKDGAGGVKVAKLEILSRHPSPEDPEDPEVYSWGKPLYDQGYSVEVEVGATEVDLVLPVGPCALRPRSHGYLLETKSNSSTFPVHGNLEFTVKHGVSNRVKIAVRAPKLKI